MHVEISIIFISTIYFNVIWALLSIHIVRIYTRGNHSVIDDVKWDAISLVLLRIIIRYGKFLVMYVAKTEIW